MDEQKEVVKLTRTDDKYMAEAPEKFEGVMDDLNEDLNVEQVDELQQ